MDRKIYLFQSGIIPLFLLFLFIGCGRLGAKTVSQSPRGSHILTGICLDAATGEPIVGATVILSGTTTGTATTAEGTFRIYGLQRGEHVFDIQCIPYLNQTVRITLPQNQEIIEIFLEEETETIGEIMVTTRKRSDTENAMVATVRDLKQVASGLSAGQIARSGDRNASEAVRRIPGITIIDDRFIVVRGLSQRYNNAWIDGMALPSTETDSRAFSFDVIPSGQIDNMIVYKSPAPEIPADFAGGFVVISTKSITDENSASISYTTGFNTKTQFHGFMINPGSKTDLLGFDLSKRPLSKDFPSHLNKVTDPDRITWYTRHGFNNDWSIKTRTPVPDQRFSGSLSRYRHIRNEMTFGSVTTFNYSNTHRSLRDMKNSRYGLWSVSSDTPIYLDDYIDNQYSNDTRIGAMENMSLKINNRHSLYFRNMFNLIGRNRLTLRTGIKDMSSNYYREETEMLYSSRLTYTGQFSGKHDLEKGGIIDWNGGYSYASRSEPDRRIITYQAGIGSAEDIPNVTVRNNSTKRYFQTLHDNIWSGSVNYVKNFQGRISPALKSGAYLEHRDRNYTPREFEYRTSNLSTPGGYDYLALPVEELLSGDNLSYDKIYIEEVARRNLAYSAKADLQAFYAALELNPGRWTIYAGARLENYTLKLTRDKSVTSSAVLMTTRKYDYTDILPSANITYKISDIHQLRAAYGRSLNRPEMREVSPAVYYDFDLFNEIGGNENLKTAYIHNVDLRYEFYPSRGEMISVGVFYKHFTDPIEWSYIDMGGTLRYNFENARSADNTGIEIDIRKEFGFGGRRNFTLVLNAAWIHSNIRFTDEELLVQPDRPMQGQSPYVINGGLFYRSAKAGFGFSILYNRIGKRIVGIGKSNSLSGDINSRIPDSYEMPRNQLDISLSKNIGKYVEINLSVRDLISEDIVYKQFPRFEKNGVVHKRSQITKRYNPGRTINAGINIKL